MIEYDKFMKYLEVNNFEYERNKFKSSNEDYKYVVEVFDVWENPFKLLPTKYLVFDNYNCKCVCSNDEYSEYLYEQFNNQFHNI